MVVHTKTKVTPSGGKNSKLPYLRDQYIVAGKFEYKLAFLLREMCDIPLYLDRREPIRTVVGNRSNAPVKALQYPSEEKHGKTEERFSPARRVPHPPRSVDRATGLSHNLPNLATCRDVHECGGSDDHTMG